MKYKDKGRVLAQVNNQIGRLDELSRAEDGRSAFGGRKGAEAASSAHGWLAGPKARGVARNARAANASLLRRPSVYLPFTSHPTLSLALNCTQWQHLINKYLLAIVPPTSFPSTLRQHGIDNIPPYPHTLANPSRDRQLSTPY